MRNKNELITVVIDDKIECNFFFEENAYEDEIKIVTAIFNLEGIKEQVKDGLMTILNQVSITCRTELVREVFVTVSSIYYPNEHSGQPRPSLRRNLEDINMTFYTEYVVQREITQPGLSDREYGFVSSTAIGRFSRKQKKFREISDNMLSGVELL